MNYKKKEKIFSILSSNPQAVELAEAVREKNDINVSGLWGSAIVFVLQFLFDRTGNSILYLCHDPDSAAQMHSDLREIVNNEKVLLFTSNGRHLWSELGPLDEVVGARLQTIKTACSGQPIIIVTSPHALIEKVASPEAVLQLTIPIKVGKCCRFDELIENIIKTGYIREARVDRPGEMSVRGGIIDIFMYENLNPVRIDFFGNVIESIREFDVETQRSIKKIESVDILPLSAAGPYGPPSEKSMDDLEFSSTLLEYLPEYKLLVNVNKSLINNNIGGIVRESAARLQSYEIDHGIENAFDWHKFYLDEEGLKNVLKNLKNIDITHSFSPEKTSIHFDIERNAQFAANLKLLREEVEKDLFRAKASGQRPFIQILCESDTQSHRIKDLLEQENFPSEVMVDTLHISEGFYWPEQHLRIYTNKEIYGKVRMARKADRYAKRKVSFHELFALKDGDYVVHIDYGIGVFRGLKTIDAYGKIRECLQIEYLDGDMLYVPLDKMDRVQKYSSRDGFIPSIAKLGSRDWQRLKSRTKKRVKEIAEQLIRLYATRKMKTGYTFSNDTVWQKELEASFIYEETIDQLKATSDIKIDMECIVPMDRLVCGDVGFGKTEVAVRAAFKAINDSKQVAMLVPTTVLAQQHYLTFCDRMRQFPINIQVLSRFKSQSHQAEIVNKVAEGKIDLIIGTHRLLSKDIRFKDLGLLIVDEEHKFGVMHKEKLKLLKETVDTITLSATPIPRTMHLALMGARDISVINIPPGNRIAIKTEVCRWDKSLIRDVMLREVDRGGQIFFVHNRVQTIYSMHKILREIVPEISISVAHGQMNTHQLEKIMMSFAENKVQCLLSTMIIESGIDVPNANTLIVNRADKFGLAQLYQLRGRVGRSDKQAYAYLLIPSVRKLTRNAIKRLQTIQEYAHLGSGYKIAMRDLEIRGAGNVFGSKQSGFVDALGYELYTKIIEDATGELKKDMNLPSKSVEEKPDELDSKIELNEDAYLPPDYMGSAADRVNIYKRLIEVKSLDDLNDLVQEIKDRFGKLPKPAKNLIDYIEIKILAQRALLEKLSFKNGKIIGHFHTNSIPRAEQFTEWIGKIVEKAAYHFELKQLKNDLLFEVYIDKTEQPLEVAKKFLQSVI